VIYLVYSNINEDKRKAEGHQVMFEIVNDIENCPVSLWLSDWRLSLVIRCINVLDSVRIVISLRINTLRI